MTYIPSLPARITPDPATRGDRPFTGTILGPVVTDTRTGEQAQQVIEYQRGQCVDRYVTVTRYRSE